MKKLIFVVCLVCSFYCKAQQAPFTYLHLNKSSYIAGEYIWFSAYLTNNESKKIWDETEVVFVQLFDKNGKVVEKTRIQTQNGRGWGKIKTPNDIESGLFRLKGFTAQSLINQELSTEKVIDIIHPSQPIKFQTKINNSNITNENLFGINLKTEKTEYLKREKIKLHIFTKDPATLSVSVVDLKTFETDSLQSIFFKNQNSNQQILSNTSTKGGFIVSGLAKEVNSLKNLKNFSVLILLKDELHSKSFIAQTDNNGRFKIENMQIFGEATLTYQGVKNKGRSFPIVIDFDPIEPVLQLNPIENIQKMAKKEYPNLSLMKINDEINLDSTIILDEVAVKAERSEPKEEVGYKLYDKPTRSYVVDGKSRGFTSVFDLFAGMISGVHLDYSSNGGGLIIPNVSIAGNTGLVLYVLDGVPLDQSKNDLTLVREDVAILMSLDPNDIYRVDLLTHADASIYGTRASGGVISIFTKRYANISQKERASTYKIIGYDYKSDFKAPDYSKETKIEFDNRQTIYWNPEIVTNEKGYASVEFYSADLPTNYAIIVEGMTEEGKVGRAVKKISVR